MFNFNKYFIFLYKNNFYFYINFLFLKNFNFYIYIQQPFYNYNTPTIFKKITSHKYFNKFNFKSIFFYKFIKYFNFFNIKNVYYEQAYFINSSVVYNNFNLNILNKKTYNFLQNFLNIIYYLTISKKNFLILDDDYKFVFTFYNYIYNNVTLNVFKNYFLVKPLYFTFKKWVYFYETFCFKFNVQAIIIYNYIYYSNFINEISRLDLPLAALIPLSYNNLVIDYPLFINTTLKLNKLLYSMIIYQTYFLAFNFKSYVNKIKFIKLFYIFSRLN